MTWEVSQQLYNILTFTALLIFFGWALHILDKFWQATHGESIFELPEDEDEEVKRA